MTNNLLMTIVIGSAAALAVLLLVIRLLGKVNDAGNRLIWGTTNPDEIEARREAADKRHREALADAQASRDQAEKDLAAAREMTAESRILAARLRELQVHIPEIVRNLKADTTK